MQIDSHHVSMSPNLIWISMWNQRFTTNTFIAICAIKPHYKSKSFERKHLHTCHKTQNFQLKVHRLWVSWCEFYPRKLTWKSNKDSKTPSFSCFNKVFFFYLRKHNPIMWKICVPHYSRNLRYITLYLVNWFHFVLPSSRFIFFE